MRLTTVGQAAEPRRVGRGSLERVGDIRVLRVAGSDYEMGYQHGALLAEELRRGPIPYFRHVVEKMLGGSLGPASKLVWPTLQRTIGRRVARELPEHAHEHIRGLADGAGMDPQVLLDGCTMPDAMMWVAARVMGLRGHGPAVAHRLALQLEYGCTSAVAWGSATEDGALLHARTFDYLAIGVVLLLVAGSLADRQTFQRIDREARERTRDGLVTSLGQLRGLLAEHEGRDLPRAR